MGWGGYVLGLVMVRHRGAYLNWANFDYGDPVTHLAVAMLVAGALCGLKPASVKDSLIGLAVGYVLFLIFLVGGVIVEEGITLLEVGAILGAVIGLTRRSRPNLGPPARPIKMPHKSLRIFISYRREDSQDWADRLHDFIKERDEAAQVIKGIDTIAHGDKFNEVLSETVRSCDALIAVIGPGWLASDARIEIATALRQRIHVIPCLVNGARMPRAENLPDELTRFERRQALILTHEGFRSDGERLMSSIAKRS